MDSGGLSRVIGFAHEVISDYVGEDENAWDESLDIAAPPPPSDTAMFHGIFQVQDVDHLMAEMGSRLHRTTSWSELRRVIVRNCDAHRPPPTPRLTDHRLPQAHRPPPTPRLTDHRLPLGSPTTAYPQAHRPPPTPRLTDHRLPRGSPTTAYPEAHRPPPTPRLTDHRLPPRPLRTRLGSYSSFCSPTTAYPQAHRPPPTPQATSDPTRLTAYPQAHRPPPTPQATSDPTRLTDHRLPPGSPTTAYPPGHFGPDSTVTEYRLSERFWALALPEVKSLLIERRTRSKTLDYLGMYCNLSRPDTVRDFVASISDKGYDFRVPARLLNPVVIAPPCVPLVDGREDVDAPDE
ncbi:uncharacterized protein ISCGN_027394 [Ixodes scapularis]